MVIYHKFVFICFVCSLVNVQGGKNGTLAQECLQRPEGELDEELADFLKHCQINPRTSIQGAGNLWIQVESRCGELYVIVQIEIVRTFSDFGMCSRPIASDINSYC